MEQRHPDDSLIRQYAAENDMHFRWKTSPRQGNWKAEVWLGRNGFPAPCWGVDGDTEQGALTLGMECAIGHYVATASAGKRNSHLPPPTGSLPPDSRGGR